MTSVMASTTMAFSTSTSSLRASQSQHAAAAGMGATISYGESPLTQLPAVGMGAPLEELRRRMAEFSGRFDAYIEGARKRVLAERNEYRARMSELDEERRSRAAQMAALRTTLTAHEGAVARAAAEAADMHAQIGRLQTHQAAQQQRVDALRRRTADAAAAIERRERAQREHAGAVERQARLNAPELAWWEEHLGVRIDGAGDEGRIRIAYAFPPPPAAASASADEAAREAVFELGVPAAAGGAYEVVGARPRLEPARVAGVLARLNDTRELAVLLKGMRALFAEAMAG